MKKIITLAFGVAASLAANAGVLYWQVATTESGNEYQATTKDGPVTYTYAMLKASSETSPELSVTTYFDDGGDGILASGNHALAEDFLAGNYYFTDYGSATVNSIWIELYNDNGLVAESGKITGGTLKSLIDASKFSSNFSTANSNVAAFSSFNAVPEPTSGLMLLIGAAMLGLRRKKVA